MSILGVVLTAALVFTGPGVALALAVYRFLEFYTGVFALVALSLTAMTGFVSTDRTVLLPRHRVSLQTAHRITAILAATFLAVHICLKVVEGHVSVIAALIPFTASDRRFFLGLGTIAFYLLAVLVWTGLARARFAHSPRPWIWRAVHIASYPTWLLAIVHGLASGRHAAPWVTISYVLCVVAVALGALLRAGVTRGGRAAERTTGSIRAVPASGRTAPPPAPAVLPPPLPGPPVSAPPMAATMPSMPARPVMAGPTTRSPRRAGTRRRELSDEEFWSHMKGDSGR